MEGRNIIFKTQVRIYRVLQMCRFYKTLRFWESSIYLFIRTHVAQARFNLRTAGDPVLFHSPPKGVYSHARLSQVYFVFSFRIGYYFFFSWRGCHGAWKFRFVCIHDQCPFVIKELSFPLLLPNPAFLGKVSRYSLGVNCS